MPFARREEVKLHWESTGAGEAPVLLIMGLGMTATGWWRTVPVLAERFRVLAFDNRGVGRSGRPPGPYTVSQMADDAVGVLDAAGEASANVYGISLGGMIAQELALRHPDRVRRLVLAATTPGGSQAVPPDSETLAFFERRALMPTEEAVWASVPYNYASRTRRECGRRIAEDIAQRLRYPVEPDSYRAQLAAALQHDAYHRLDQIRTPTLIVHGGEDRMVHPANARLLADRIPAAQLWILSSSAHLLFTDDPRIDGAILRFLEGVGTEPDLWPPRSRVRSAPQGID
jgi:3-oxoadipate enol-lactonase